MCSDATIFMPPDSVSGPPLWTSYGPPMDLLWTPLLARHARTCYRAQRGARGSSIGGPQGFQRGGPEGGPEEAHKGSIGGS